MLSKIFLSHSSENRNEVRRICEQLHEVGIDVWASFKDIKPGMEWDQSIQAALNNAEYVLLAVSEASVTSSYVRAEIEYALNKQKTVIPILIEKVDLPLRWHTLQFVDYTTPELENQAIQQLSRHIPKSALYRLKNLLDSESIENTNAICNLVIENDKWIFDSKYFNPTVNERYEISYNLAWSGGGVYVNILMASPFQSPFTKFGTASSELESKLGRAKHIYESLEGKIYEDDWTFTLEIFVLIGRYSDYSLEYRHRIEREWEQNYKLASLTIMSYDQLVKLIEKGSSLLIKYGFLS